jgi:hypothetical protein
MIEDILKDNYTLILPSSFSTKIIETSIFDKIRKNIIISTKTEFETNYFDHKLKHVSASERMKTSKKFYINYFHENTQYPLKFAKDNLANQKLGFRMFKNEILYPFFKKNFQRLFEAGIFKVFGKKLTEVQNINDFSPYTGERVTVEPLSMSILQAGFVIWLIAVFICILVFFGEIFHYKLSQKIDTESLMRKFSSTKVEIIKFLRRMKRTFRKRKSQTKTMKRNLAKNCSKLRQNLLRILKFKK